jgi:GT2 family glycosyltransferase
MGTNSPRVTISLVTWNGLHWLPACFESIITQTLTDWELLIIDNGSTDGSCEWLRGRAPTDDRIRVTGLEQNTGYSRPHNQSIRAARGEAVLLLNQDVVLDPGFLNAALAALETHPHVGSVQGRMRRLGPDGQHLPTLDTTGLEMHRSRLVVSRDQLLEDDGAGGRPPGVVWGADGPAPVYRRAALLDARLPRREGGWEVLDEDFYAQKEDVDLAWRLDRLGWSCWFEPKALGWHARTGAPSRRDSVADAMRANLANPLATRILAWRNQRLMQLKNDDPVAALRDLPWILGREAQQWLFVLMVDQRRLRAIPQLLRLAPMALRKRRAIRSRTTQ